MRRDRWRSFAAWTFGILGALELVACAGNLAVYRWQPAAADAFFGACLLASAWLMHDRKLAYRGCMCMTIEDGWRPCPPSLCERPTHHHA